jgi:hypothetical protein
LVSLRYDHQEINITVGGWLAASLRSKDIDPFRSKPFDQSSHDACQVVYLLRREMRQLVVDPLFKLSFEHVYHHNISPGTM